jgi:hypothetical protein
VPRSPALSNRNRVIWTSYPAPPSKKSTDTEDRRVPRNPDLNQVRENNMSCPWLNLGRQPIKMSAITAMVSIRVHAARTASGGFSKFVVSMPLDSRLHPLWRNQAWAEVRRTHSWAAPARRDRRLIPHARMLHGVDTKSSQDPSENTRARRLQICSPFAASECRGKVCHQSLPRHLAHRH